MKFILIYMSIVTISYAQVSRPQLDFSLYERPLKDYIHVDSGLYLNLSASKNDLQTGLGFKLRGNLGENEIAANYFFDSDIGFSTNTKDMVYDLDTGFGFFGLVAKFNVSKNMVNDISLKKNLASIGLGTHSFPISDNDDFTAYIAYQEGDISGSAIFEDGSIQNFILKQNVTNPQNASGYEFKLGNSNRKSGLSWYISYGKLDVNSFDPEVESDFLPTKSKLQNFKLSIGSRKLFKKLSVLLEAERNRVKLENGNSTGSNTVNVRLGVPITHLYSR